MCFGGFQPLRPTGRRSCCPRSGSRSICRRPENGPRSWTWQFGEAILTPFGRTATREPCCGLSAPAATATRQTGNRQRRQDERTGLGDQARELSHGKLIRSGDRAIWHVDCEAQTKAGSCWNEPIREIECLACQGRKREIRRTWCRGVIKLQTERGICQRKAGRGSESQFNVIIVPGNSAPIEDSLSEKVLGNTLRVVHIEHDVDRSCGRGKCLLNHREVRTCGRSTIVRKRRERSGYRCGSTANNRRRAADRNSASLGNSAANATEDSCQSGDRQQVPTARRAWSGELKIRPAVSIVSVHANFPMGVQPIGVDAAKPAAL
jgi:hypothetical protein